MADPKLLDYLNAVRPVTATHYVRAPALPTTSITIQVPAGPVPAGMRDYRYPERPDGSSVEVRPVRTPEGA